MTPRSVFQGSNQEARFDCETCHSSFDSKLYNVLTGYWCPYCKKKTETILNAFLEGEYPIKKQARFDWCRFSETGNIMPFDVMRKDHPILIELDGNQHFIQISNWGTPEIVQKKDVEKIQYSIQNGYSIIHLPQEDVWHDRYDWKTALREVMASLESADPQCIFLCSDPAVYEAHLQHLGESVPYRMVIQERVGPVKEGRTVLGVSKSSKK
jgi:very-short-patch-repair endonuclease